MVKVKVPYLKHLTDGIFFFFKYVNLIKTFKCTEEGAKRKTALHIMIS